MGNVIEKKLVDVVVVAVMVLLGGVKRFGNVSLKLVVDEPVILEVVVIGVVLTIFTEVNVVFSVPIVLVSDSVSGVLDKSVTAAVVSISASESIVVSRVVVIGVLASVISPG